MSSTEIYERLFSLMEMLFPDIKEKQNLMALTRAWAAGLILVRKSCEDIFSQMFLYTMSEKSLNLFCNLLDIDTLLNEIEKREQIKEKLSRSSNDYMPDDFISYCAELGKGFLVSADNFQLSLGSFDNSSFENLGKIMKGLEYSLPPCVTVKLDSNGLTFGDWDSKNLTYDAFDNMQCMFSILDTM